MFRMDQRTVMPFTSLTETMVIHVRCTFGKSFYSAADITGDFGYVYVNIVRTHFLLANQRR